MPAPAVSPSTLPPSTWITPTIRLSQGAFLRHAGHQGTTVTCSRSRIASPSAPRPCAPSMTLDKGQKTTFTRFPQRPSSFATPFPPVPCAGLHRSAGHESFVLRNVPLAAERARLPRQHRQPLRRPDQDSRAGPPSVPPTFSVTDHAQLPTGVRGSRPTDRIRAASQGSKNLQECPYPEACQSQLGGRRRRADRRLNACVRRTRYGLRRAERERIRLRTPTDSDAARSRRHRRAPRRPGRARPDFPATARHQARPTGPDRPKTSASPARRTS